MTVAAIVLSVLSIALSCYTVACARSIGRPPRGGYYTAMTRCPRCRVGYWSMRALDTHRCPGEWP